MPDLRFHSSIAERVQPAQGALAAAILGVALSVIAFFAVSSWEDRAAERSFQTLAQDHIRTLQHGIDDYVARLAGLRAFFNATEEQGVTREEFETYARELMRDLPGLYSMSWTPRVTDAEREAFERAARDDGIESFRISVIDQKGDKAGASPIRADYYPVYYSTQPHNAASYGIDLQDGGLRQRPLDAARDNDRLAATGNFRLQTGDGNQYGFYVVLPVYKRGLPHETLEQRRQNIVGFVRATFQFHLIADAVLSGVKAPVNFFLFEMDAQATHLPAYVRTNGKASDHRVPRAYVMTEKPKWVGDLQVADRHWEAVAVPNGTSSLARHNRAWIVLASGLVITSIVALLVWSSTRYMRMLEAANAAISEQALTDPLTGLANRRHFVERLTEAFATADRTGHGFALHFMDLDGFKTVNDTHGHPMGDALLKEVADRLRARVREIDFVARFGGDEFAILQTLVKSPIAASNVAEKLVQAVAAPYRIGGVDLDITASFGIALYTAQVEGPTSLMMQADLALYSAKAAGRNAVRIYGGDAQTGAPLHEAHHSSAA
ncbi:diguanylate cyclase domain-containing protein [Terrihabitans soli]|uniref:sensor domain-containing diguanylate cyclase n=1 Tax=Terrihabitans soli TaxID=708113 RepID=UPI001CA310CE|nr:diguanylate cyclase [Terrihabitans soli]